MTEKISRLELLKKKQEQISARIELLEAAEKSKERKKDTRRKILLGAYVLDKGKELGLLDQILPQLDNYLTRKQDRALFDLEECA